MDVSERIKYIVSKMKEKTLSKEEQNLIKEIRYLRFDLDLVKFNE